MYHTSPAQRDFSVTSAPTSHGSATERGTEREKGHVSLLFAFQSLNARWISTLTRSLSFSFRGLLLVATDTAL